MTTSVRCPKHPDETLIEDYSAGDLICPKCGLVVGDRIVDVSSEWRTFSSTDKEQGVDKSRVGAAENDFYEDSDLSTNIQQSGYHGMSDDGKPVYNNRKQVSSADRHLMSAFAMLAQMCDRLNLPSAILVTAKRIFKQVQESKKLQGRNNEAVVAACLYLSCRREQVPRTFKEVCGVCSASKKEIGRVFKLILKNIQELNFQLEAVSSQDYINRFGSILGLDQRVISLAKEISKRVASADLTRNHSPVSVAAADVMIAILASDVTNKTVDQVAEVTGVAASTIRSVYRDLSPSFQKIFPETTKHSAIAKLPGSL